MKKHNDSSKLSGILPPNQLGPNHYGLGMSIEYWIGELQRNILEKNKFDKMFLDFKKENCTNNNSCLSKNIQNLDFLSF